MKTKSYMGLLYIIVAGMSAFTMAQTSGANGSHDPSRMVECNGKVYVYSTGGGGKSSTDGFVWKDEGRIFSNGVSLSSTITGLVPSNQGIWAPDCIFYNNLYYLFYSIANSSNDCAIGCLTSPTLESPKWTDQGVVVSNPNGTYCAIDPAPFVDAAGDLWLCWGSGYSKKSTDQTIYVTRLDNKTGLASTTDVTKPGYPLKPGHIEAGYVYYRSPYYYVFWNKGGCCNGTSSTYEILVARSDKVTGPYTGDRSFYASNSALNIHGPGHIGIYDQHGYSRFTYHYYPSNGSVIGENELGWSTDGWPVNNGVCKTAMKLSATGIIKGLGSGKNEHLVMKNIEGAHVMEIIDISGRIVMRKTMSENIMDYNVSLNEMPKGVYMMRMQTSNGIVNRKLVVSK